MAALPAIISTGAKIAGAVQKVKAAKGVIDAAKSGNWKGAIGGVIGLTGAKIPGISEIGAKAGLGKLGEITGLTGMTTVATEGAGGFDWKDNFLTKKINKGFTWLESKDNLSELYGYGKIAADVKSYRQQKKALKQLRDTTLDIPAREDFEVNRNEMMDILDTDPSELSSKFGEGTLRKHGIDPGSLDAQAMLKQRGFRSKMEQQRDSLSRQMGRSGAFGNAALGAASAQMGLQGSMYDAQMGLQADQMFTQQLSNLQQRAEGSTNQLMSMEESMAQWEYNKQLQATDMERRMYQDVSKGLQKARLGLEDDIEAEVAKTEDPVEEDSVVTADSWDSAMDKVNSGEMTFEQAVEGVVADGGYSIPSDYQGGIDEYQTIGEAIHKGSGGIDEDADVYREVEDMILERGITPTPVEQREETAEERLQGKKAPSTEGEVENPWKELEDAGYGHLGEGR